jgi:hypothetical protein
MSPNVLDLSDGWLWSPDVLRGGGEQQHFKSSLGAEGVSDNQKANSGSFDRSFTIPAGWKDGKIEFNLPLGFVGLGKVSIDKKEVWGWSSKHIENLELPALLPDTEHTISIEVQGAGRLIGTKSGGYLVFRPQPIDVVDLGGVWQSSDDGLSFTHSSKIPGPTQGNFLRRLVSVNRRDLVPFLCIEAKSRVRGALINGHWFGRSDSFTGSWRINISNWLVSGENVIHLVGGEGDGLGEIQGVSIELLSAASLGLPGTAPAPWFADNDPAVRALRDQIRGN